MILLNRTKRPPIEAASEFRFDVVSGAPTGAINTEILERKLAISVLERAAAAKTKHWIVMRWWRFDADN